MTIPASRDNAMTTEWPMLSPQQKTELDALRPWMDDGNIVRVAEHIATQETLDAIAMLRYLVMEDHRLVSAPAMRRQIIRCSKEIRRIAAVRSVEMKP